MLDVGTQECDTHLVQHPVAQGHQVGDVLPRADHGERCLSQGRAQCRDLVLMVARAAQKVILTSPTLLTQGTVTQQAGPDRLGLAEEATLCSGAHVAWSLR